MVTLSENPLCSNIALYILGFKILFNIKQSGYFFLLRYFRHYLINSTTVHVFSEAVVG